MKHCSSLMQHCSFHNATLQFHNKTSFFQALFLLHIFSSTAVIRHASSVILSFMYYYNSLLSLDYSQTAQGQDETI